MAITRIKNSTISNKTPKYNDVLAGLPFRPIIGTATDGGNGTSASVAFTGNNPAGAGITYTALSSPGSFTGTGTVSPITVSGLTAGTAYTFQVKAGNSLGDSAYSAASNSVTPVTPTAFESIASATGTGSSGTITFSSIPGTYQSLQLRYNVITSATQYARIQFNSDTGANYARHSLRGNGIAASATGIANGNWITIGDTANGTNTTYATVGIIDIQDYASTTRNKTVRDFGGLDTNSGAGAVCLSSGVWLNTSAINSITFYIPTDNFTSSTTVALYGIKGAV